MGKYIDGSGLSHFMGIIKGALAGKSDTGHTHSQYVTDVAYNSTSRKLQQAKNGGTATDIVTLSKVATSNSYTDLDSKPTIPTANTAAANIKMDGTQAAGSLATFAKADHVHPSDTSRAPTNHASTTTTYGAGTGANYGHVILSDSTTSSSAAANSVAATPKAVKDAIAAAKSYTDDEIQELPTAPFEGATSSTDGAEGVVPQPLQGQESFVLRGDGGWEDIGDTLAAAADVSAPNGFVRVEGLYDAATGGSKVAISLLNAADIPALAASKINSGTFDTARIPNLSTDKLTSGTLGVARGGTGVSTLGAGVVYHSASGTGALSIASDANIVSAIGNKAVARATGDADGNAIKTTYAKLASPALTGTPTAPTAAAGTNTTQIATTAFVTNAVGTATAGALQYKGTVNAESTITGAAYKKGWYYVVATAGTYLGKVCEVGDMLIAKQDKTGTPANDWDAVQSNIETLSNSEIDALWAAA